MAKSKQQKTDGRAAIQASQELRRLHQKLIDQPPVDNHWNAGTNVPAALAKPKLVLEAFVAKKTNQPVLSGKKKRGKYGAIRVVINRICEQLYEDVNLENVLNYIDNNANEIDRWCDSPAVGEVETNAHTLDVDRESGLVSYFLRNGRDKKIKFKTIKNYISQRSK